MKSLLLISLLAMSFNSYATGGFYCSAVVKNLKSEKHITFNAGTSRVDGQPLLTPISVTINEVELLEISTESVVNYWNYQNEFKILALDSNFETPIFELNYNYKQEKGSLKIKIENSIYKTNLVTCEFE